MDLRYFFYSNGDKIGDVIEVLAVVFFIMSFIVIVTAIKHYMKEENDGWNKLGFYGMIFSEIVFVSFVLELCFDVNYTLEDIVFMLFVLTILFLYPISLLCMTISMKKHKLCFIFCILCIVLYITLLFLWFWLDNYYWGHSSVLQYAR